MDRQEWKARLATCKLESCSRRDCNFPSHHLSRRLVFTPFDLPAQVDGDNIVLKHLCSLEYYPPANTSLVRVLGPVYSDPKWKEEVSADMDRIGVTMPTVNDGCLLSLDPAVTNTEDEFDAKWSLNYVQDTIGDAANVTMFLVPLDPAKQYQITLRTDSSSGYQWSWCVVSGFQTYPFH